MLPVQPGRSPPAEAAAAGLADFEDYWRYHRECEHQRLYPGVSQGQYTLGA